MEADMLERYLAMNHCLCFVWIVFITFIFDMDCRCWNDSWL